MRITLLTCYLLVAWLAVGVEVRAEEEATLFEISAFLEASNQQRAERIEQYEVTIEGYKKSLIRDRRAKNKQAILNTKKYMADFEKKLKKLRDPTRLHMPALKSPINRKDIGILQYSAEIFQVIDSKAFLANISLKGSGRLNNEHLVCISGLSTANMADGETFSFDRVFQVTKTHQYTTVVGAVKTIWKLEPFDLGAVKDFVKQHPETIEIPKKKKRKRRSR